MHTSKGSKKNARVLRTSLFNLYKTVVLLRKIQKIQFLQYLRECPCIHAKLRTRNTKTRN